MFGSKSGRDTIETIFPVSKSKTTDAPLLITFFDSKLLFAKSIPCCNESFVTN